MSYRILQVSGSNNSYKNSCKSEFKDLTRDSCTFVYRCFCCACKDGKTPQLMTSYPRKSCLYVIFLNKVKRQ